MEKQQMPDYKALDQPQVVERLFHPRKEEAHRRLTEKDLMIPVDTGVTVGACFHLSAKGAPTILFFHGNGEIVSDYDDLGGLYNNMGINFIVVDYRGYGRSTGTPSVSTMMTDCHQIFNAVQNHLETLGFTGALTVMGRSLGSAPALELVSSKSSSINALIIESGFAQAEPLLTTLGIDTASIGFAEAQGFGNADKISQWHCPTLIIHGEFDHIIPFSDGQALYEACGATEKTLLKIPNANHNDIFYRGMKPYMEAIKTLLGLSVEGQ